MKISLFAATVVVLATTAAAQTPACPALPTLYKIIQLPLHPTRINNTGMIAGTTEENEPATWSAKSKDEADNLKPPAPFDFAHIFGLNQNGDIVGDLTNSADVAKNIDKSQAFVYSKGKFTILSQSQSKARAINNAGEIAGESNPEGPVMWKETALTRLGGCCGGRALALNNHGQIVGEANDKEGRFSAFLWDKAHGLQLVPPPNSTTSTALAINDAGHILLQSLAPNAVYIREQGQLTPVRLSEEFASQPLALNNCDVIVGEYGANSEYYRAFIWDRKNGMRDLNKLIDAGKEWVLESAVDINDRGEIIGSGDFKNEEASFLLVPDPPRTPVHKK